MARKTKEEALLTRCGILDAAERLFQAQGVSGTSLQDIAQSAGVTRGAVYWHFKDKGDLFNAMMDRVCMPMEQSTTLLCAADPTPLASVRAHLLNILARVVDDAQVRRVFDIATHMVEYVSEMTAVRERHLQVRGEYLVRLERHLRSAQLRSLLVSAPPARHIAIGLHALLDGLIQNWVLDPKAFDLRAVGAQALDLHLAGLSPQAPARQH